MTNTLKLAFVGCGAIASFHRDAAAAAERIRITAAIDPEREKAAQIAAETGAEVFGSLEEALEGGDFDAVDLMLPHDLHERVATTAFQAGKHVLLEKPMAPTLDACDRILAAAKEAGTVFMVAENAQYWPEVVSAQKLIREGAIGDLITARAAFVLEFDGFWFKDKKPWRYDKARTGGGIAIDGGSHWLRPLRMWMGEIEEVVAVADHPCERMEGESLMRALLRFRSGKIGAFDAMMIDSAQGPDSWWRVTGSLGEIVIESGMEGTLRLYDAEHREGRAIGEPQGYVRSFYGELADFAAAVLDGKAPEAGPEHSLGELRTALAMYRSVESGRWEKVWE